MFEDKTYKRCACKGPLVDKEGKPVFKEDGTPKIGYLEKRCPKLKKREHGSWYYSIELPPGPGRQARNRQEGRLPDSGGRGNGLQGDLGPRPRRRTGQVHRDRTEFLHRWFANRVDLKRSTRKGYEDHIERVFIPALGHLKMRDLRTRHIQDMFKAIWADNKVHQQNREAAEEALDRRAHRPQRMAHMHDPPPADRAPPELEGLQGRAPEARTSHATSPAPAPNSR